MITLEKVHKHYGQKAVLQGVTLQFPARQITALIGPNGAGKSTLLMSIARLHEIDGGEIRLDGQPVSHFAVRDYARRVATLRQHPEVNLRLTLEELVAFGRYPYSQGRFDAADQAAIDQAIVFLGLQDLRQSYVDELSGGQRQMAFLAMSIAQETDYLLLDEPLNNLDMKHATRIMQAIERLRDEQGRTIILVVHDINFAANYADHIVAMKEGAVYRCGPVAKVVTSDCLRGLYDLDVEVMPGVHGVFCNYFKPATTGVMA